MMAPYTTSISVVHLLSFGLNADTIVDIRLAVAATYLLYRRRAVLYYLNASSGNVDYNTQVTGAPLIE
jgi:hypothetical protein